MTITDQVKNTPYREEIVVSFVREVNKHMSSKLVTMIRTNIFWDATHIFASFSTPVKVDTTITIKKAK